MGKEMDLDGFLGHTTRGPGANFLDGWKKRNPPQINIVLHTKAPITAVWQHQWPKIVTIEKDGKERREVWSNNFNSWETEEVLTKQFKRLDNGQREFPPVICPMSLLLEEIFRLWDTGQVDWDTELFRFVGDDPSKAKRLHVAGMLNQLGKVWDTLSDAQKKKALADKVPSPKDAWMENMQAKCQYVFIMVDYDNVKDGVQVAKETTLVGDKMKKVIRDRMASEGDEKGHPMKNPYVFQWQYHANEKQFQDKYHVLPIGKLPITDAIMKLIRDTEPPDISRWTGRGNIEELRASMEDSYVGPAGLINFDAIFAAAEELAGVSTSSTAENPEDEGSDGVDIADEITGDAPDETAEAEDETTEAAGETESAEEETPEPEPEPEPEPAPAPAAAAPAGRRRKAAEPAEDPAYVVAHRETQGGEEKFFAADGMELNACDNCQTIMRGDEVKCRKCGEEYEPIPVAKPTSMQIKPAPKGTTPPKQAAAAKPAAAAPAPASTAKPAGAATKPAGAATSAPKPAGAAKTATTAPKPSNGAATAPKGASPAEQKAKAAGKDRLGF